MRAAVILASVALASVAVGLYGQLLSIAGFDYMKMLVYTLLIAEAFRLIYPFARGFVRGYQAAHTYRRAVTDLRRMARRGTEDNRVPSS